MAIIKTTWDEARQYDQSYIIRRKLLEGGARDRHLAHEPEKMRWEWSVAISVTPGPTPGTATKELAIALFGRVWHWCDGASLSKGVIPNGVKDHPWVVKYGKKAGIPQYPS